ncbi:MAG: GntR family transcriptional regulator [Ottowia sp.]|uniref:GntR family transcriptional regulator n=1 Tax=Ottowia sp. TaxID=1898956 RepID=UPI003C736F6B
MADTYPSSSLATQLALDIRRYIAQAGLLPGARLPERSLADHFRVSRSPIRAALGQLETQGLIARQPEGGFTVREIPLSDPVQPQRLESDEEAAYLQIARDRLDKQLPEKITENELMRRYGLTKSQLSSILRRMANEGWIERLPGHGWTFLPALTSAAAYTQSYRFRVLMEPAAILEPTYQLDRAELLRCRDEQRALVEGAVFTVLPDQIFDANTRLHECITNSSGNMFIADALRRLNRVRRLIEYRKAVDREQAHRRCVEHLKLIELLLADEREAAADFIRMHLRDAAREKASIAS